MEQEFPVAQTPMEREDNIRKAGRKNNTLALRYQDKKGAITTRYVEPYELRDDSLFAHCLDRGAIRNFKINQIISARETGEKFTPRHDVQL